MTFREYLLMVRGYDRIRSKEFEHTRAITYMMMAVNRDPNKSLPTIHEYWALPTDAEQIQEREEDLNELHARMLERLKKAHPKRFQAQA